MERPNKFLFNIKLLALAFDIDRTRLTHMISKVDPVARKGRSLIYDIKDVAQIVETRDAMLVEKFTKGEHKKPHHPNSTTSGIAEDEDGEIINDPEEMNALQKINFYKAEDLKQSALAKKYKNDIEEGKLLIGVDTERVTAEAFKKIALVLDTLPDLLERDGIIGSGDIERVINILDNSRDQLAIDLSEISPATKDINDRGEW